MSCLLFDQTNLHVQFFFFNLLFQWMIWEMLVDIWSHFCEKIPIFFVYIAFWTKAKHQGPVFRYSILFHGT